MSRASDPSFRWSLRRQIPTLWLSLVPWCAWGVVGCGEAARDADSGGEGGGGSGGEGGADCEDSERFAQEVRAFEFGEGQSFGQEDFPEIVLGGPRGGGKRQGSMHVVSLGDGGFVELSFGRAAIVDGPGPDFLVFENPFDVGGDPAAPYAELGVVAVSEDGEEWFEFPCTATEFPYGTCAGWRPVEANVETGVGDPFDPASGGDPFDLADLGLERARYVRVRDLPGDGVTFDLDAVSLIHAVCE